MVADDGTTQTYNLFGLDLILEDDGTDTRILLSDGLGSVRVEMIGNVVEATVTYEPFGKLLAQAGDSGTTYGYTGERYDITIGLVYLRARYYNPNIKVFMSRDPFSGHSRVPASQHPYSYVRNNPVNLIDPTGECFWDLCISEGTLALILLGLLAVYVIGVIVGQALQENSEAIGQTMDELWEACKELVEIDEFVDPNSDPDDDSDDEEECCTDWPDDDDPERDIALGWEPVLDDFTDFLNEVYNPQGRIVYNASNWVPHVTRIPKWGGAQFRDAAQNASIIHFEIGGVEDFLLPKDGLTYEDLVPKYGALSEPQPYVTLWELSQINTQGLCHKTIFYRLPSMTSPNWEVVDAPKSICS